MYLVYIRNIIITSLMARRVRGWMGRGELKGLV